MAADDATKSGEVKETPATPEQHTVSPVTSFAAEKETTHVDQAALMGAALAAIVALVVGPGQYESLSTIIGATLLFVIFAYYRLKPWPDRFFPNALLKGMALAAVTGLCACLIISWPVQRIWVNHNSGDDKHCTTTYELNGRTGPVVVEARDNCLGDETTQLLGWFWLGFILLGTLAYLGRWWSRSRDDDPALRLSPMQVSQLYAIITERDPQQLQFEFGPWTRKIIRDLIRPEFGVKFSEVQVGMLLKRMGLSAQPPLYRAYQQDSERAEKWKKAIYPDIRKRAAGEGAIIFFEDEAGVRTDHCAGTTRGPVEQNLVTVKTGERKSISMVTMISPDGEVYFGVQEGRMNADSVIDFLKPLLDSIPGKVFLVMDGHPVHKAKKISEFAEKEANGRLKIFFLPPYSPGEAILPPSVITHAAN